MRPHLAALFAATLLAGSTAPAVLITEKPLYGPATGVGASAQGSALVVENDALQIIGPVKSSSALVDGASTLTHVVWAQNATWIADPGGNQIFRLNHYPETVLAFAVPTPNAGLGGMCAAPDGSVWFTEISGNKIGRISYSGGMNEYSLPNPGSAPFAITAGPDGAMWFTEYGGNRLGRIDQNKQISEIPLLTPAAHPTGIASFGDYVAVTESSANKIATYFIDAQNLHEFSLPEANSFPYDIVWAPDGYFYFTERNANKIGRMSQSGNFMAEFPVPTPGADPTMLALGADGSIYFTETNAAKLGQLHLTAPGDVNGDGHVDVGDVFYFINFLFAGGPALK